MTNKDFIIAMAKNKVVETNKLEELQKKIKYIEQLCGGKREARQNLGFGLEYLGLLNQYNKATKRLETINRRLQGLRVYEGFEVIVDSTIDILYKNTDELFISRVVIGNCMYAYITDCEVTSHSDSYNIIEDIGIQLFERGQVGLVDYRDNIVEDMEEVEQEDLVIDIDLGLAIYTGGNLHVGETNEDYFECPCSSLNYIIEY